MTDLGRFLNTDVYDYDIVIHFIRNENRFTDKNSYVRKYL